MTDLGRLLEGLDAADLARLAERLSPYLSPAEDRWISVSDAASYAACSVHAIRHALSRGEIEFEQRCAGGKVFIRRSSLDRWRQRAR